MEKFNLEKALAGKPVIARIGKKVEEIHFFKTNVETKTNFFKGYIYGVANGPGTGITINIGISTWSKNNSTSPSFNNNLVTFGTPFYFYFGLKKGKTAIDLFNKKWVNSENVFI